MVEIALKSATTDSSFILVGVHECTAALGRLATSTVDLRYQWALNNPGVLAKALAGFVQK